MARPAARPLKPHETPPPKWAVAENQPYDGLPCSTPVTELAMITAMRRRRTGNDRRHPPKRTALVTHDGTSSGMMSSAMRSWRVRWRASAACAGPWRCRGPCVGGDGEHWTASAPSLSLSGVFWGVRRGLLRDPLVMSAPIHHDIARESPRGWPDPFQVVAGTNMNGFSDKGSTATSAVRRKVLQAKVPPPKQICTRPAFSKVAGTTTCWVQSLTGNKIARFCLGNRIGRFCFQNKIGRFCS